MRCPHVQSPALSLRRRTIYAFVLLAVALTCGGWAPMPTAKPVGGGERRVVEEVYGPVHRWLVKSWADQEVLCEVYRVKDGQPDEAEIRAACGSDVAEKWSATPACENAASKKKSKSCEGLYLVYLGKRTQTYEKVSLLPGAEAHFALLNCANAEWCGTRPKLRFYGREPLADETITSVHIKAGKKVSSCNRASDCIFSPTTTTGRGIWLEYWVVSSLGDESAHEFVQVRNVYKYGAANPYYLEVLSPETSQATAELQWSAFPDLEHPEASFYAGLSADTQIATDNHLFFLTQWLIHNGEVDTSQCAGGVLLSNGSAGGCGEAASYPTAVAWQNQYDEQILDASRKYGLPPRVLKGILTQESQFWPDPQIPNEYGLGSLTEQGVDALLVTDTATYLSVCLPAHGEAKCAAGYDSLTEKQRAVLRGMLLRAVGTDQEIDLIARVLLAQVVQVGQITSDVTKNIPGQVTTYEDLWDLTIASYHAGPGCIKTGLKNLYDAAEGISFEQYCQVASSGCQSACTFTEKVKGYMQTGPALN